MHKLWRHSGPKDHTVSNEGDNIDSTAYIRLQDHSATLEPWERLLPE